MWKICRHLFLFFYFWHLIHRTEGSWSWCGFEWNSIDISVSPPSLLTLKSLLFYIWKYFSCEHWIEWREILSKSCCFFIKKTSVKNLSIVIAWCLRWEQCWQSKILEFPFLKIEIFPFTGGRNFTEVTTFFKKSDSIFTKETIFPQNDRFFEWSWRSFDYLIVEPNNSSSMSSISELFQTIDQIDSIRREVEVPGSA